MDVLNKFVLMAVSKLKLELHIDSKYCMYIYRGVVLYNGKLKSTDITSKFESSKFVILLYIYLIYSSKNLLFFTILYLAFLKKEKPFDIDVT